VLPQDDQIEIRWRLHLASPPVEVFGLLTTDVGRARFWAESTLEENGIVIFRFPNGISWRGEILERIPPRLFRLEYYGGSVTTFELDDDGAGGTDLLMTDEGVAPGDRDDVLPGWVSVLMALKAAADFGVDLRNHDPKRTWDQGFADN
jgi:uncharacterized protein YndB with AHSA1/START domain